MVKYNKKKEAIEEWPLLQQDEGIWGWNSAQNHRFGAYSCKSPISIEF